MGLSLAESTRETRVSIGHIIVDPTQSTRGAGEAATKSAARNAKKNPIHEHEKSQFTGD